MSVKKSSTDHPNPVTSADEEYLSLRRAITVPIQAMTGEGKLPIANHLLALR